MVITRILDLKIKENSPNLKFSRYLLNKSVRTIL